jgi:hypothetical protein
MLARGLVDHAHSMSAIAEFGVAHGIQQRGAGFEKGLHELKTLSNLGKLVGWFLWAGRIVVRLCFAQCRLFESAA